MESGKNRYTPRELTDDVLLRKLLSEHEETSCQYGRRSTQPSRRRQAVRQDYRTPMQTRQEQAGTNTEGCVDEQTCANRNCMSGWPLAMSYTPDQEWQMLYELDEALEHGTIFNELDLPFYPGCKTCRRV